MEPITTRMREAFKGQGGVAYPEALIYSKGTKHTATLKLLSGSVTYDSNASYARSFNATLAAYEDIIPEIDDLIYKGTMADTDGKMGDGIFGDLNNRQIKGLLLPGSNQIRIFMRFRYSDGTTESLSMGYFNISKSDFQHSPSGGIIVNLSGFDVMNRISLSSYPIPYNISAGTNIRSALISHLNYVYTGISLTVPSTSYTTPALTFLPMEGANPLEDAKSIAISAGWILDSTRQGGLIAEVPKDPGSGTPVWRFAEDSIMNMKTQQSDQDIVNSLTIYGETSDGAPIYGNAVYNSGPWGIAEIGRRSKYEDNEFVTSTAQANMIANTKLPLYIGFTDSIDISSPFVPHLDNGDIVTINNEEMGYIEENFIIESITHDLATFKTDLVASRRLV